MAPAIQKLSLPLFRSSILHSFFFPLSLLSLSLSIYIFFPFFYTSFAFSFSRRRFSSFLEVVIYVLSLAPSLSLTTRLSPSCHSLFLALALPSLYLSFFLSLFIISVWIESLPESSPLVALLRFSSLSFYHRLRQSTRSVLGFRIAFLRYNELKEKDE